MSDTVGMTLTEFLLARVRDDERVLDGIGNHERVEHIIDHDACRARLRAECEAKRSIVERCGPSHCGSYLPPGSERGLWVEELGFTPPAHFPEEYAEGCDGCAAAESVTQASRWVLCDLAAVYADHPDYQQEWKP